MAHLATALVRTLGEADHPLTTSELAHALHHPTRPHTITEWLRMRVLHQRPAIERALHATAHPHAGYTTQLPDGRWAPTPKAQTLTRHLATRDPR